MRDKSLSVNGQCIFVLCIWLGDSSIIHLIALVNYRRTGFNVLKSYLQTPKSFMPALVLGLYAIYPNTWLSWLCTLLMLVLWMNVGHKQGSIFHVISLEWQLYVVM